MTNTAFQIENRRRLYNRIGQQNVRIFSASTMHFCENPRQSCTTNSADTARMAHDQLWRSDRDATDGTTNLRRPALLNLHARNPARRRPPASGVWLFNIQRRTDGRAAEEACHRQGWGERHRWESTWVGWVKKPQQCTAHIYINRPVMFGLVWARRSVNDF